MSNRWTGGFIQAYFDPLTEGPLFNTVVTAGRNFYGDLGLNDRTNRSSPVQLSSDAINWSVIAGGDAEVITGVTTTGELYAWGRNSFGALGLNVVDGDRSSPVQIGALTTWSTVESRQFGGVAIKTDGTLWAWGLNDNGQCGLNDIISRSSPVQVGALTTWSKIASFRNHVLAIKTDGTLWAWGDGASGKLGSNNGNIDYSSPIQITSSSDWSAIGAGYSQSYAVKTNGTFWSFGQGYGGMLGHNDRITKSSPTQVGALTNWLDAKAGFYVGSGLKTDGTLWTWGLNSDGVLGLDLPSNVYRSSPIQVGTEANWSTYDVAYQAMYAINTDSEFYAWGSNGSGELADNSRINRSAPVQVGSSDIDYVNVFAARQAVFIKV